MVLPNETRDVPYEEYFDGGKVDKGFGDLAHIGQDTAHYRVIVRLRFQDIEGYVYRQEIGMGKGGYKHGFVELVEEEKEALVPLKNADKSVLLIAL